MLRSKKRIQKNLKQKIKNPIGDWSETFTNQIKQLKATMVEHYW